MKINMFVILTIVLFGCSSSDEPKPVKTVIYLIRHAEKADSSANPNLSAAGLQRANNWAIILQDVTFSSFYSTNYNRTLQTIEPTANSNDKEVELYNPANFSLEDVIAAHSGTNVMIVGHSNTIPQLINTYLGSNIYPEMAETEFGNLYKITIVDGVVSHEMTVHN
ncbi:SixA phosphatase family protein [Flavobacterium wongokense]|uniref:SixA phosphatase family protein n=1 Tax=Flavobacterium wongokense TaxID=2910674 RepID=UPI001F2CCED2|nr:phosphoglycerate mutase family protein [Flavobacterium sp. WG47]MCF6132631.1 histidine phosphatase family protein [Flavobacterium sp. WG47]